MPTDHTDTQPSPNISTEHQREGDARRPGDALDRGQTTTQPRPNLSTEPGGTGDGETADRAEHPNHTPGGNDQEPPEKRPNVGIVEPDDYPADQRGGGTPA